MWSITFDMYALYVFTCLPQHIAINKAYKMFQDEEQVQFCKDVAEEARKQLETRVM